MAEKKKKTSKKLTKKIPAKKTKPGKKQIKKTKKPVAKKKKPVKKIKKTKAKPKNVKKKRKSSGSRGSKKIIKTGKKIRSIKKRQFRGRFGKRGSSRKISNKKWQKWRKKRGESRNVRKEDGLTPKTGFGKNSELKGLHPSGFKQVIVYNLNDLKQIKPENTGIIVASAVGKRKKKTFIKKAKEMKIKIFN